MTYRHCVIILCFIVTFISVNAQGVLAIDSTENETILKTKVKLWAAKEDTNRIALMGDLGLFYEDVNIDSSIKYGMAAYNLATTASQKRFEARELAGLSGVLRQQGKFAEALDVLYRSLKIAQEHNYKADIARAYRRLAIIYFELEDYARSKDYASEALVIDIEQNRKSSAELDNIHIANTYERLNIPDSALLYANRAKDIDGLFRRELYYALGNIYLKKGDYFIAKSNYLNGYKLSSQTYSFGSVSKICNGLTSVYLKLNNKDSAIYYAKQAFEFGKKARFKKGILTAANSLAALFDSSQPALALSYLKIANAARDSLFGASSIQTIQELLSKEQARQNELEDAKKSFRNRLIVYAFIAGLIILLVITLLLYRGNKQKQKANSLLKKQKEEIQFTLTELKSTQQQLIQSEKMASLGELTAGIAHEIQNPLNFVNNFSDLNKELADELEQEIDKGNFTDAKAVAKDIKDNEEKINHHGKRADAIVKGMLQHSRTNSGQKESTDINALADEYLRLGYHGLRAKDKSFNATTKTDFDKNIEKINVVPQDIGRVILNLINNAFYAVSEKQKQNIPGYEPTITITSKKVNGKVELRVIDNGYGIPQKVLDKIFQPFFTTKPTGQGTGLGLSLAYDIVKAHGGEIKVETKENEGTTFTIRLPLKD